MLRPEDLITLLSIDPDKLDCAGVKLTLSTVYVPLSEGFLGVKTRNLPEYKLLSCEPTCHLPEGSYIVRYNEYVRIPNGYIGLAIPRSSLLRMGATIYSAVWDPGYEGQGIGLLSVFNKYGIKLEKNTQIAQLVYIKMTGKTSNIYRGIYLGERDRA